MRGETWQWLPPIRKRGTAVWKSASAGSKADIERVINAVQGVRTETERVRTEFQTEIGKLRTEFRTEIERVRTEFRTESERNRTEIERNRADIIKMIVQIAGVGMALMAVGFAFLRLTGTA